jgi:hypothetical protein
LPVEGRMGGDVMKGRSGCSLTCPSRASYSRPLAPSHACHTGEYITVCLHATNASRTTTYLSSFLRQSSIRSSLFSEVLVHTVRCVRFAGEKASFLAGGVQNRPRLEATSLRGPGAQIVQVKVKGRQKSQRLQIVRLCPRAVRAGAGSGSGGRKE